MFYQRIYDWYYPNKRTVQFILYANNWSTHTASWEKFETFDIETQIVLPLHQFISISKDYKWSPSRMADKLYEVFIELKNMNKLFEDQKAKLQEGQSIIDKILTDNGVI